MVPSVNLQVDAKGGTRKSDAVPIDAAELERALLRLFVARHVSPKQARGSVVGNFAFSGLLRVLSPEAFDEVLRDALTRAAARNPEVGVHALLALVEHCGRSAAVQACLESVVHPESKFGGALQLLRSDKAANRRFAVSFLGAFAARATNTFETLGGLFREIGALVDAPKAQVRTENISSHVIPHARTLAPALFCWPPICLRVLLRRADDL